MSTVPISRVEFHIQSTLNPWNRAIPQIIRVVVENGHTEIRSTS